MNNQSQYSGQTLTLSIAQELIQELFAGQTVELQEIRAQVNAVHIERDGLPSNYQRSHPVSDALSSMRRTELAENIKRGVWFIKPRLIKTLDDFMKWARKFDRGEYVFRGITNEKYGIQASAYLRPKENRNFEKFLKVNTDLIRDARLRGYHQRDGQELHELEILAGLQHFGAATCLIDFTYSAQIALRFACDDDSKETQNCSESQDGKNQKNLEKLPNGKVFAVRNKPPEFKEINPDLLKKSIDYFLQDGEDAQLYCWQPRHQNNRIIAQRSIFLFGRYEFSEDDLCIIDGCRKEYIMNALQQVSGITEDSLFPDFEGFAYVRRKEAPYTELTASEYRNRGFLAYERKEYKNALADYNMAIDLQDNDPIAYYRRGLLNYDLEQYDDARADYDMAIDLDPNYVDAFRDRGLLNYDLEQYDDARADYDMAIDLDPYNAEAYTGSGLLNYQLGLYDEALEDFDEAIRLNPNSADDYHYRAVVKFRMRRIQDALVDFDEGIRLNPNDARFYLNRGLAKSGFFLHESAILDYDEVIRREPENATAYFHRALSKFRLNHLDPAKEDLLTAQPLAVSAGDEGLMEQIEHILFEINFRLKRLSE